MVSRSRLRYVRTRADGTHQILYQGTRNRNCPVQTRSPKPTKRSMLESALLRTLGSRKYMNKSVYTAVTSSPPLDPKALADFKSGQSARPV